jgi:lipopolysaccharide/colanic/teichoic acid biosynthesis glycosyltransferase
VKRALDILGAVLGMVLLSPLIAAVAVVVRFDLGRPILFRQQRSGLHGKPFTLLKFRTMNRAVGPDGNELPDAMRLSKLGRFLRRSSLDELTELFNVLKGDMSLVGPRPLLPEYMPLYSAEQARRHEVRPGITGWAQVNGRNGIEWDEKFLHDVWYVDNRTMWLDLKILLLSVIKVVRAEGISQAGHSTMEKFRGSAR